MLIVVSATPIVPAATNGTTYDRLHSVLSSAYHVPPPLHVHPVRSTLAPSLPIIQPAAEDDADERENESQPPGQVVTPAKTDCVK